MASGIPSPSLSALFALTTSPSNQNPLADTDVQIVLPNVTSTIVVHRLSAEAPDANVPLTAHFKGSRTCTVAHVLGLLAAQFA